MRQWDRDAVGELRASVFKGDGAVVELVRGRLTDDVLQTAGDGLLEAIARDVDGAADMAAECSVALRKRGWDGDDELADQLDASLGSGPTRLLRPVQVDLDHLASMMEGDPVMGGCRIDLRDGGCWPSDDGFGDDDEDDEDEDRWLYVEAVGSHDGYRDMEIFIATVTDPDIADRLEIAINGKGAFRRFKDVLSRWPDELQRYYQLSNERQRGRARAWLAYKGFRPVPERA